MAPYSMAGLLSCALSASSYCGAEATTSRRRPAASSYLQGPPPGFDHRIRELQLGEGQQTAEDARLNQGVDLGIHVLHARIGQHDWGARGARDAPTRLEQYGHGSARCECV